MPIRSAISYPIIYLAALTITGCANNQLATLSSSTRIAKEGAVPVEIITKEQINQFISNQWKENSKSIYAESSFSDLERNEVLLKFALEGILYSRNGQVSDLMGTCAELNLIEIKKLRSPFQEPAKREEWTVDACTKRINYTIDVANKNIRITK